MTGQLAELALRAGWSAGIAAPEPVLRASLTAVADRVWRRRGRGVLQLEANLSHAVPGAADAELRDLSRRAMRSYFRYWAEVVALPGWERGRIVGGFVAANQAVVRTGFAAGRGAILALPHMGNWDLAGAWCCLTGMPVTAVAERLEPASLYERFVRYRERLGLQVVGLTGANPLPQLRDALAAGRLVCLVADRDLTTTGLAVHLLDAPARLPAGPAVLARLSGAPLHAVTLSYQGRLLVADVSDPIPARPGRAGLVAMTQDVADHFSAGIRAHPADWHMLQPIFAATAAGAPGQGGT